MRSQEEIKQELDKTYAKIGELFYQEVDNKEMVDEKYRELFTEAKEILFEIDVNKAREEGKCVCAKCSNIVSIESKYCNMCGSEIIKENDEVESADEICIICGIGLDAEAVFCPNCGADLQKTVAHFGKANSMMEKENAKDSSNRTLISRVITLLCVAGIIIMVIALMSNTHVCDRCNETFVGDSYFDTFGAYDNMCEDCAKDYYRGINYKQFKN